MQADRHEVNWNGNERCCGFTPLSPLQRHLPTN
jgi:hypothetical protein